MRIENGRIEFRLKEHDPILDIYILQRRIFRFFWKKISIGTKAELENYIEKQLIESILCKDTKKGVEGI